jgi:hypothetical protein
VRPFLVTRAMEWLGRVAARKALPTDEATNSR